MPPEYQCRNCGIMYRKVEPRCCICEQENTVTQRRAFDTMYKFWSEQTKKEAAGSTGAALGIELMKMAREELVRRNARRLKTRKPVASSTKKRYVAKKSAQNSVPAGPVQCSSDLIRISRPRLIP